LPGLEPEKSAGSFVPAHVCVLVLLALNRGAGGTNSPYHFAFSPFDFPGSRRDGKT